MEIKILGINGSHRSNRNTRYLVEKTIKAATRAAKKFPIETEIINLSELNLEYCKACYKCNTEDCSIDDDINMIFEKMKAVDGIVIGSPVYLYDVSARLKTLMDRSRPLIFNSKDPMALRWKVGGAVVVHFVRSAGAEATVRSITNWFHAQQMIVAGNAVGLSGMKGGVTKDDAGKMFAKMLGKKMVEMIKKLKFSEAYKEEQINRNDLEKIHSKMY
ncbi:MAG: flavodoxin family protein [Candidatus Helarchaeota archaeon]